MKKCIVYGNCQAMAIRSFLSRHPEVKDKYEFVDIKPVHLLSQNDVSDLEEAVRAIDLFIFQPVSDNYRNLPSLSTNYLSNLTKKSCKKISFPTAYFTGYNPEITYLKGHSGIVKNDPFPYHDINILRLYANAKSSDYIVRNIQEESFYDEKYILENCQETISKLKERESNLTIKLSGYIERNFRKAKLFHSFNHPSADLLEYLFTSIVRLCEIEVSTKFSDLFANADVLGQSSFPAYKATQEILSLQFQENTAYRINHESFSIEDVVLKYVTYYENNKNMISEFIEHTLTRT